VKGFHGQRPIFPLLRDLALGDHGGFYLGLSYDAPGPFPTIEAALAAAMSPPQTKTATRRKRVAGIRKPTPLGAAQNEYSKRKRKFTRPKRG
jgi:hypothetical protein